MCTVITCARLRLLMHAQGSCHQKLGVYKTSSNHRIEKPIICFIDFELFFPYYAYETSSCSEILESQKIMGNHYQPFMGNLLALYPETLMLSHDLPCINSSHFSSSSALAKGLWLLSPVGRGSLGEPERKYDGRKGKSKWGERERGTWLMILS